jgi:hypothetical protein
MAYTEATGFDAGSGTSGGLNIDTVTIAATTQ